MKSQKVNFSLILERDNYNKIKQFSEINGISCGKIINLLIEGLDIDTKICLKNKGLSCDNPILQNKEGADEKC